MVVLNTLFISRICQNHKIDFGAFDARKGFDRFGDGLFGPSCISEAFLVESFLLFGLPLVHGHSNLHQSQMVFRFDLTRVHLWHVSHGNPEPTEAVVALDEITIMYSQHFSSVLPEPGQEQAREVPLGTHKWTAPQNIGVAKYILWI